MSMFNVGDEVAILRWGYLFKIAKVTKITKTMIGVGTQRFNAETLRGVGDSYYQEWGIRPATAGDKLDMRRRLLASHLAGIAWTSQPLDVLQAIWDLLQRGSA